MALLRLLFKQRLLMAFVVAACWTALVQYYQTGKAERRIAIPSYNPYAPGNAQGVLLKSGRTPGKWGNDNMGERADPSVPQPRGEVSDWGER